MANTAVKMSTWAVCGLCRTKYNSCVKLPHVSGSFGCELLLDDFVDYFCLLHNPPYSAALQ